MFKSVRKKPGMVKDTVKNDLKLILLLCLVVTLLFLLRNIFTGRGGMRVIVMQDGNRTAEYDLSDTVNTVIKSPSGGSNTLHISDKKVWISDASCPDKICEKQGPISREGEMIVCLPNRLSVSISK